MTNLILVKLFFLGEYIFLEQYEPEHLKNILLCALGPPMKVEYQNIRIKKN
jgi:hypothetical protein